MSIEQFFSSQRGLTRGDGVSLKTNDDVWRTLGNAKLTVGQLNAMGDGNNPATNQSIKAHPRFNALITEARQRENQAYNAVRTGQKIQAQQAFDSLGDSPTVDQIKAREEELLQQGMDPSVVYDAD